jgi:hypothetical protein
MKRLLIFSGLCWLLACGGSNNNPTGNNQPDGSIPDGGTDGGATTACVDRPADLSRPPNPGVLPCELLPPR